MKLYGVTAIITGNKYLGEFEAESEEEAIELALKAGEYSVSLCHQCSNLCQDPEVTDFAVDEVLRGPK